MLESGSDMPNQRVLREFSAEVDKKTQIVGYLSPFASQVSVPVIESLALWRASAERFVAVL
jgi:hypothetical protein